MITLFQKETGCYVVFGWILRSQNYFTFSILTQLGIVLNFHSILDTWASEIHVSGKEANMRGENNGSNPVMYLLLCPYFKHKSSNSITISNWFWTIFHEGCARDLVLVWLEIWVTRRFRVEITCNFVFALYLSCSVLQALYVYIIYGGYFLEKWAHRIWIWPLVDVLNAD